LKRELCMCEHIREISEEREEEEEEISPGQQQI
jgi:hypothetical protein